MRFSPFLLGVSFFGVTLTHAAPSNTSDVSKSLIVESSTPGAPVLWWPEAPFGGKPVSFATAIIAGKEQTKSVSVSPPTSLNPNALVTISPYPVTFQTLDGKKNVHGQFKGRLVFIGLFYAIPASLPYIVMSGVNTNGDLNGRKENTVSYQINPVRDNFWPLFSQTGRSLLFQSGDVYYATSVNNLLLWDFPAKQLTRIETASALIDYVLSPETQFLAAHYTGWDGNSLADRDKYLSEWRTAGVASQTDERDGTVADLQVTDLGREGARLGNHFLTKMDVLATDCSIRPIVWTQQGTILYTANPVDERKREFDLDARPSINEVSPNVQASSTRKLSSTTPKANKPRAVTLPKPRILIKDAYDPSPSRDGRYIAFYGWREKPSPSVKPAPTPPLPPDTTSFPRDDPDDNFRFALFVFDRQTKTRYFVADGGFGRISWTPDGKGFVTQQPANDTQVGGAVASDISPNLMFPKVNEAESTVSFYRLQDIVNAANNRGLVRDMKPKPSKVLAKWTGLRRAVSFSKDGVLLFLADTHNIYALDLRGSDANNVETIAHIEDPNGRVLGCDWLDEGSRALPLKKATPVAPSTR